MSNSKNSSQETNKTNQENLSQEELREKRKQIINHYRDEIPLLKIQKEHTELLADIEDAKYRRMEAMHKVAYVWAESQKLEKESDEEKKTGVDKKTRKLKTD